MVAGVGFEPHDLRVMSPTSYRTAPSRDKCNPENGTRFSFSRCYIIIMNSMRFVKKNSLISKKFFIRGRYSFFIKCSTNNFSISFPAPIPRSFDFPRRPFYIPLFKTAGAGTLSRSSAGGFYLCSFFQSLISCKRFLIFPSVPSSVGR